MNSPGEQSGLSYHYRDEQVEAFYVLDGTLHVETPDEEYAVDADQALFVDPGSPQRAFNPDSADETVRVLAIGAPSVDDAQSNENTQKYIQALEDLGFLRVKENTVRHGRKIDSADLQNLSHEKFRKQVIGDIIVDGYYLLRKELGLMMLNHFPVFANSYYISAFRRGKSDLWLTVEDVMENLQAEYDRDEGRLAVEDKFRDLARVGVVEFEDGEISGHSDIYHEVQQDAPIIG